MGHRFPDRIFLRSATICSAPPSLDSLLAQTLPEFCSYTCSALPIIRIVYQMNGLMVSSASYFFLFLCASSHLCFLLISADSSSITDPVPAIWPEQFHSVLFMNNSEGLLQKVDLWYDWPNGRNFNIIQNQLGKLIYDLEWDNGTSFIYTLDDSDKECRVLHFDVGILRPNWLDGATYLGQKYKDRFLCNVWEKVDFIWYYEDVDTKRPVHWRFFNGMVAHVMTFEVGSVLEDPNWQAPVYCFQEATEETKPTIQSKNIGGPFSDGNMMREFMNSLMWL